MIQFEHIEHLYYLFLIPFITILYYINNNWIKRNRLKFSSQNLLNKLIKNNSIQRKKIKNILQLIAITSLIIGISNPKIGTNIEEIKREGIEIIIALDLSNSMLCEDIKPNRLTRSKQAISNLIDQLEGDKIGLVIFAGEAYTQLPITSDYSAAKMFLENVNTKTIKNQGTNIGDAIDRSLNSFNFTNDFNKSIIIITDGEDHEEDAFKKSKEALNKGVYIHTLAVGEKGGGPIPLLNKKGFKKDRDGNIIVSKPNFDFLSELANSANGININANNSEIGLKKLFEEINKIEKKEISDMIFTDYKDRFPFFLAISLTLLMINLCINEHSNEKFNE